MLERDVERKVCDYAKKKGVLTYKFTSPGCRGVCDRIYIYDGTVFFIEFKASGKKPTTLQLRHHETLRRQSMSVYVVDNVDYGKEVIDGELDKRSGSNG